MNAEFRDLRQIVEAKDAGVPAIIASYVHARKFNDEPQGVGVIYGSVTHHFSLLQCSGFVLVKTTGMQPRVESIFRNNSLATKGSGAPFGANRICESDHETQWDHSGSAALSGGML